MIRIYADINCPFCYALNEWVQEAELQGGIDWRVVDHNPQASFRSYTDTELVALTQEVFTIRQRAPDIRIELPRGRSNVAAAGTLLCAVRLAHPDYYDRLRTRIYRAYWAEGLDIESSKVLDALVAETGLGEVDVSEEAVLTLAQWTAEWNDGPYERRIPVLLRDASDIHVGLSPKAEALNYLRRRDSRPPTTGDSCGYAERVNIAVLGDWKSFWPYAEGLRGDSELLYYDGPSALAASFEEPSAPDIVIVSLPKLGEEQKLDLTVAAEVARHHGCPTMLLTSELDEKTEMDLYRLGYSDVLTFDRSLEIVLHKIHQLIGHRQTLNELLEKSLTDSLTELYNRRKFTTVMEHEWLRSSRTRQPLSVLILDIDHFKKYNDLYGHLAGDGCLRVVAQLIREQVTRNSDIVCRIGGEEFGVVLPNTDSTGAAHVAERMRSAVFGRQIPHADSEHAYVSLSAGGATRRYEEGMTPSDLLALADEQLYRAKDAGRNTYRAAEEP